jgi:hypothetical protein
MVDPAPSAPAPLQRRWFDLRHPIPTQDAQHRVTAFIYGNIVVLATLAPINLHEVHGRDVVTVLGIAISTFLAHVFANVVTSTWSWDTVRREARDSAPILTSGVVPALLVLTALFGVPSLVAVLAAELVLVLRLALLGVVVARLQVRPASVGSLGVGIGLAAVALVIVITKAVLAH